MSSKKRAEAANAAAQAEVAREEVAREKAIFEHVGINPNDPISDDLNNQVLAGMQLRRLLESAKPNYTTATGKPANGGKRRKSRRIRTKKSTFKKSTFKKSTFFNFVRKSRAKRRAK
jgi:hypothetical protein